MIDNFDTKIKAIACMAKVYDDNKKENEQKRVYTKIALEFVRALKFMYLLLALDVSIEFGNLRFEKYKNGIRMVYENGRHCTMPDVNEPRLFFSCEVCYRILPKDMLSVLECIPNDVLRFLVSRKYEKYAEEIISAQQQIVRMKSYKAKLERRFNEAGAEEQLQIINRLNQMDNLIRETKTIHVNTDINDFQDAHQDSDRYDDEPYYVDVDDIRDMDRFPDIC